MLRQALALAGVSLPEHGAAHEAHLADGRIVEAAHISCDEARSKKLEAERAPPLLIDDEVIMHGEVSVDDIAKRVLKVLLPDGLAELRP